MRVFIFILSIICLACSLDAQAQLRKQLKKRRPGCIKVKNYDGEYGPAVGFRIGDPFGLTAKYTFPKYIAVELLAGSSFAGLNTKYVQQQWVPDSASEALGSVDYVSHEINYILSGQLRIMYTNDFNPEIAPRLKYYIGVGVQFLHIDADYIFTVELENEQKDLYSMPTEIQHLGPEYMVGVDYNFKDTPLNVFCEVNLFAMEAAEPLAVRFMGGMGVRWRLY